MTNVLVFSHEQDVDGVFAAAILKIVYPNSDIVLTNYGLERMLAVKDKIISFVEFSKPGIVIIADIGVNEESYMQPYEAMCFAKQSGWKNIWIDHHPWTEHTKNKMGLVSELILYEEKDYDGIKKCASELCVENLAPDNELGSKLAIIAHRTDFPDSLKFPLPPLTGLISYYLGIPHLYSRLYFLIDNIVKGILWTIEMQQDIINSSKLIDESIAKSIKEMKVFEVFDNNTQIKVAITRSEAFVNRSILLGKIMDDSTLHIAIAFTTDGKVSIRRNKDITSEDSIKLNCNEIAKEFKEGGGHEGAAGGFLISKPQESPHGDEIAVKEIFQAVSNYIHKTKKVLDR